MKNMKVKEIIETIELIEALATLEELVATLEEQEKAVAEREMPTMAVPFFEEFEVEDLVMVNGDELGMIIAIDDNDNISLPYLVRIGDENRWVSEEEIELADLDELIEEGEKEVEAINEMKDIFHTALHSR